MKRKLLIGSLVFLLFLFLFAGCDKEEWEFIELNDNTCGEVLDILDTLSETEGTIELRPEVSNSIYFIIFHEPETSNEMALQPCNLPLKYQEDGLKIFFSGEVVNIKDWDDDETQPDFFGTPFNIITAKIRK